jgi:ferredoxin
MPDEMHARRDIETFLVPLSHRFPYDEHMRVHIDSEKCQGHNRCYALAPELFDVDDYGTAFVLGDGTVTPTLADKARLAVANCPELAISVTD